MLTKVNEGNRSKKGSNLKSLPCISCENDDDTQDSKEQLSASKMFIPNRHKFNLNLIREKEKMMIKQNQKANAKLPDKCRKTHQIIEPYNRNEYMENSKYQSSTELITFSKSIFATNQNFNIIYSDDKIDKKKTNDPIKMTLMIISMMPQLGLKSYKAQSLRKIKKVAQSNPYFNSK